MAAEIGIILQYGIFSLREARNPHAPDKARMRLLFTQEGVATSAGLFLGGAAGDPGLWRQQAILGRGRWDADALRDIVREYALEHLAEDDAVLVVDEPGFLKQ